MAKKTMDKPMESGFSFFPRDNDLVINSQRRKTTRTEGVVILNGLGGVITLQGTQR